MRFGILGPLSVTDGARETAVTAGRDRVVLAMLLVHPGRIVAVDELIDALWADDPPATARGQLQTCVSRLRRTLPHATILTDPAGYGIDPDPGDLDATVFTRLVAAAHETTDPDAGRLLLRQALDLWRGSALAGIDSTAVRQAAGALDEQRMVATEDWTERELAAGHHRELLGELSGLVERFPLRERLRGRLMLALARAGRPADALAEYRRGRAVLRDELGIEPGRDLRDLHQRILAGEETEPVGPAVRIRCLPRTVADFTGRADTVRRLVKAIEQGEATGPVVAVVDGMAGSGKTTLALHVAQLVGEAYPDAHLFIDLHGHSERAPIEPSAGLLALLRQLGIAPEQIPAEPDERVALWRSQLAGRRVLVVFDNATSSAQLADLLPTSAGSLALVTSRRRLAGLDSVHPESLAVLADDEAVALLARIAGDRVGAAPAAAAEVVRRCGGLPLAIRLAGSRLAHRPRWQVADLVRRLGESALPELAAEDRTVASAFALSYGQLAERTQRMFRLLGLYPAPVFDALAAAAVADLPLDEAEDLLDDLVDVHLLEEPAPGFFRLHDLLREYAAALSADIGDAERRAAVVAVLDFQLHAIAASVPASHRAATDRDLRLGPPLRPDLVAADPDPKARVERERPSLDALIDAGAAVGHPEYAWLLPRAAWRLLWSRGYHDDIARLQRRAMLAAQAAGDRSAEAMSANYLGSVHFRQARYEEARHLVDHAVRIRRELGEITALATSMGNLSAIDEAAGRFVEANETAAAALRLPLRRDARYETGQLLNNVAVALDGLGRYAEGLRAQRQRLMLLVEVGDHVGIANSLLHIAVLKRRTGTVRPEVAFRGIEAALRLFLRAEYRFGEADARNELAQLLRSEGRYPEAMAQHRLTLELIRALGDRRFEAHFLIETGRTLGAMGDVDQARDQFEAALSIARAIPQRYEQARAYLGLGDCLTRSDPAAARELWQRAWEMLDRMAVAERFEAEERLGAPDSGVDLLRVPAGGETMGS